MTSPAEIADALRATSFLEGFLESHLWKLSRHMTPLELTPDCLLFEEGQARERFAIIVSGAVAIEKESEGKSTRLVTFGPGDAVGEGLLLDESPHGTTARAVSASCSLESTVWPAR